VIASGFDRSTAAVTFSISTNAIPEALGLTTGDHPKGFNLGITNGLELRSKEDIALDNSIAQRSTDDQQEQHIHKFIGFNPPKTDAEIRAQNDKASTPSPLVGGPGIWPTQGITIGQSYLAYCDNAEVTALIKGIREAFNDLPADAKAGDCWFVNLGSASSASPYFVYIAGYWQNVLGMSAIVP
jgi:hypothetical protein